MIFAGTGPNLMSESGHDVDAAEEPLVATCIETGVLQGVCHIPFALFFLAFGTIPVFNDIIVSCPFDYCLFSSLVINCVGSEKRGDRNIGKHEEVDNQEDGNFIVVKSLFLQLLFPIFIN